eukprot:g1223.t1
MFESLVAGARSAAAGYLGGGTDSCEEMRAKLDVSMITERVLAMGCPRKGVTDSKGNKNNVGELSEYLNTAYPRRYLVANFGKRKLSAEVCRKLDNQVVEMAWDKPDYSSQTPPLTQMFKLCYALEAWLQVDMRNVVALCCENGKTKTGVVAACFLVYTGAKDSCIDAFHTFFCKRVNKKWKVKDILKTLPNSLVRYLNNFYDLCSLRAFPNTQPLLLERIVVQSLPVMDAAPCVDVWLAAAEGKVWPPRGSHSTVREEDVTWDSEDGTLCLRMGVVLDGDFMLVCRLPTPSGEMSPRNPAASSTSPGGSSNVLFRYTSTNGFLAAGPLQLAMKDLDMYRGYKDSFDKDLFSMTLIFADSGRAAAQTATRFAARSQAACACAGVVQLSNAHCVRARLEHVERLTDLGHDQLTAVAALQLCNNDPDRAMNMMAAPPLKSFMLSNSDPSRAAAADREDADVGVVRLTSETVKEGDDMAVLVRLRADPRPAPAPTAGQTGSRSSEPSRDPTAAAGILNAAIAADAAAASSPAKATATGSASASLPAGACVEPRRTRKKEPTGTPTRTPTGTFARADGATAPSAPLVAASAAIKPAAILPAVGSVPAANSEAVHRGGTKCETCGKDDVLLQAQLIRCTVCALSYHTGCVGAKRIPFKLTSQPERKTRDLYIDKMFRTWACPTCSGGGTSGAGIATAAGASVTPQLVDAAAFGRLGGAAAPAPAEAEAEAERDKMELVKLLESKGLKLEELLAAADKGGSGEALSVAAAGGGGGGSVGGDGGSGGGSGGGGDSKAGGVEQSATDVEAAASLPGAQKTPSPAKLSPRSNLMAMLNKRNADADADIGASTAPAPSPAPAPAPAPVPATATAAAAQGPPLKKDPRFAKYFKMLQIGMPKPTVYNKMRKEGADPRVLDMNPDQPLGELPPLATGQDAKQETEAKEKAAAEAKAKAKAKAGAEAKAKEEEKKPTARPAGPPPMAALAAAIAKKAGKSNGGGGDDGGDDEVVDGSESPSSSAVAVAQGGEGAVGVALKDMPEFSKYFKMLKMGLPKGAVAQKMVKDNLDPAVLDMDPGRPLLAVKDMPEFSKYFKMVKMGLPKGAVKHRMVRDKLNPDVPKKRRKKLHWTAVADEDIGDDSVWATAGAELGDEGEFDLAELDDLFSQKQTSPRARAKAKTPGSARKASRVQLLDGKRAMNIAIAISRIKLPYAEIRRALVACDTSRPELQLDQVMGLRECMPQREEAVKLRSFKGDRSQLGEAEKFMIEIIDEPQIAQFRTCLEFMLRFPPRMKELRVQVGAFRSACDDVKMSKKLRVILGVVLKVGNSLNSDGKGKARAFTLDSLLKLSHTKAFDNKTTVLDYLVKVVMKHQSAALDFKSELKHVHAASRMSMRSIENEAKDLATGLGSMRERAAAVESAAAVAAGAAEAGAGAADSGEDGAADSGSAADGPDEVSALRLFVDSAAAGLEDMEGQITDMKNKYTGQKRRDDEEAKKQQKEKDKADKLKKRLANRRFSVV